MADAITSGRRIPPATIALIAAAVLALIAIAVAIARSGETADPAVNAAAPAGGQPQAPNLEQEVLALQQQLQRDPDNAQLWFELGTRFRAMGLAAEAERAFRRAMELQPRNAEYITYLGEAVLMAQGSADRRSEAEQLFQRALAIDPRNPMTRFYSATMKDQRGKHREAVDEMIALLREAPPGAAWAVNVRNSIEHVARLRNIDVSGRLPPPPPQSTATAAIPGPTREQMEAARNIPPSQQSEMVKGMVDRLAARLQQNPRDESRWMMLMRSRMVQGEPQAASAALASALAAFQDDPAAQQRLRAAAAELGIPGG
jgi:cytochrome c-type biogenesis protein CcmH